MSPEGRYVPAADPLRWLLGFPAWAMASLFCALKFVGTLLWATYWVGVAVQLLRLARMRPR